MKSTYHEYTIIKARKAIACKCSIRKKLFILIQNMRRQLCWFDFFNQVRLFHQTTSFLLPSRHHPLLWAYLFSSREIFDLIWKWSTNFQKLLSFNSRIHWKKYLLIVDNQSRLHHSLSSSLDFRSNLVLPVQSLQCNSPQRRKHFDFKTSLRSFE